MRLWLTGVNHRTAPVAVRERLAFREAELAGALQQLLQRQGVQEGFILSTCNRVEVAVTAEDHVDLQGCAEAFLSEAQRLERHWIQPHLYQFEGREAIRHIFRVAASLDSMIVGEPQILGQLKSAYSVAKAEGSVNGFLETVITRAFNVAKRVRSETEIGASAVSVSYAAVELAHEIFGALKNRKVMLVGAGKMSELAARHLARSGARILVTNRTHERAEEVGEMVNGRVIPYDQYRSMLPEVDIVITSSGAPEYLLRTEDVRKILEARRNRPIFLIDIAVPRNIEPAVNELDNVFLYDIDDLQKVVDKNLRGRLSEAEAADKIVAEEVERLEGWMRTKTVVPVIVSLQDQLEQIRIAEIAKLRGRLGALSPQQEEALEALTRGIVNKVAHGPISELRRQAESHSDAYLIEVVKRMFRLNK